MVKEDITPPVVTALSAASLSVRWGIPAKTLAAWRSRGVGPRFFYANPDDLSSVRYPLSEIEEIERGRHRFETDGTAAAEDTTNPTKGI